MHERLPRKLAAILYADVAGYSRLTGRDEDATHRALSEFLDLVSNRIESHHGQVMHFAGDAVLARFDAVVDALSSAIEFQRELAAHNHTLEEDRRVHFRVGINLGDVIEDREDIYGDGVNIAARLETLAPPGGICVSETVRLAVKDKLDVEYEELGERALKNIEEPVRSYRVIFGSQQSSVSRSGAPVAATAELGFNLPDRPSIAILPFKSIGSSPDQDYLADGIRLGIQSSLVQLSGLFLVNARVLNNFKTRNVSAVEAGNELEVRYVLDGAVQQAGNRIRATVQLTEVASGNAVMAENYDRVLEDIFELQDEITREVISAINVKLLHKEIGRIWARKLKNPESHRYFYRGVSHMYEGTREDNAVSREMFEKLHEIEPGSVIGPSNIAVTHWNDGFFRWGPSQAESYTLAKQWAEKAVEYEENNGLGHAVLGYLELLQGNHERALSICDESMELRASCPLANIMRGVVLNYLGEPSAAVRDIREALHLQRVYPPWMIDMLATAYRDSGDSDLAIAASRESLRINPDRSEAELILCSAYEFSEDHGQATKIAATIVGRDPAFSLTQYAGGMPYKDTEMRDRVVGALREAGLPD